jgi:hypothetical protein
MALFGAGRASCDRGFPKGRQGATSQQQIRPKAHKPQALTGYRVRNLIATIRATMLAKIRRAQRDFPIIDPVELGAADGAA